MDRAKLRAWWSHRQGLDGRLSGRSAEEVLDAAGWARSIGGANPYLTLFARSGATFPEITEAAQARSVYELPSARGCTYLVPRGDFAVALALSRGSATAAGRTAAKLGVLPEELDGLKAAVLAALADGPLDPNGLKRALGGRVRSLGEAGKKVGVGTTLGFALAPLQETGEIIRVPVDGRLDTQRYAYALWPDRPASLAPEAALAEVARRYWHWTGPASLAEFQWFAGVSAKVARAATEPLGLLPFPDDPPRLATADQLAEYAAFVPPALPDIRLVGSLDSLFLVRRDLASLVEPEDAERSVFGERGMRAMGDLADLASHAIVDRGRLIGLWDFDPDAGEIVWQAWVPADDALRQAVAKTEAFVRDLGDARSFSLDSPASRRPRLAALRQSSEGKP